MNRWEFLKRAGAIPLLSVLDASSQPAASERIPSMTTPFRRVRPSDPRWPSASQWQALNKKVSGSLFKVRFPIQSCEAMPDSADCASLFKNLKNPYFIGDNPALTETTGWADAWISSPSAYALEARNMQDVIKAVNFARTNDLRVVIKGGGHSYQGTSNAADSLLIWTRAMKTIARHDAFVGEGCAGHRPPQRAVSVEAGAIWAHIY